MITKFRHLERYPFWFEIAPLAITAAIMAVQRFLFTNVITYLSFIIGIGITGLSILAAAILLPATCLLLGLVSLTTGTSWGAVGLPIIGIGHDMGTPTFLYALFAIFCWLSPLFGILCALTGWLALKTTLVSKAELLLQKQAESLISGYRNMPKITSLA